MLTFVLAATLAFGSPDDSTCMQLNGCPVAAAAAAAAHFDLGELEFAPTDNTGTGTECACAAVTGTRAETLTFTRASSATCVTSAGTVVTCSSNLPRMQYVPSTTRLALLVEGAATNPLLRSEAFDNASWVKETNNASLPALTADAIAGPDLNSTADRIDFPEVSAVQALSQVDQAVTITSSVATFSIWMKPVVPGEELYIWLYNGSTNYSSRKTLTAGWARYTVTGTAASTTWTAHIGCNTWGPAHSACPAISLYVWGAQLDSALDATSYIATAGSTVTRAAELARLPWPAAVTNTVGCYSATFTKLGNFGIANPTAIGGQGNASGIYMSTGDPTAMGGHDGANSADRNGLTSILNRSVRGVLDWNTTGSALGLTVDSVRATATYDGTVVGASVNVGSLDGTTRHWGGLVSQIVMNTSVGGCGL